MKDAPVRGRIGYSQRMSRFLSALILSGLLLLPSGVQAQGAGSGPRDWRVAIYPILVWVPLGIGIDVDLPPVDGGGGGTSSSIVDGRFDGAFFGGVTANNGVWRIDAEIMWAAVGGDRLELPSLTVDADIIYGRGSVGRAIYKDLYVTGGVRRLALDYDIRLGNLPNFHRKPGVWDPLVGVAWHRYIGDSLELHGVFDGGGFGVGADVDLGGTFRVDWKPTTHFGLTAGYNVLYFKVTNTVAGQTFAVQQSMHGPVVGVGLYF